MLPLSRHAPFLVLAVALAAATTVTPVFAQEARREGRAELGMRLAEQRMQGTMGLWAEPFTTLRLNKIFNVMQDPFERADVTSNTFWDWQLNHVGSMYGVMEEVFEFAATFDAFPPRSFPPSFNPATVMEQTLGMIKAERALREAFPMLPVPVEPAAP